MFTTRSALDKAGKHTTANELKQALDDLSRRPHPDITGSIQHIGAAVECLARELCGNQKLTLGDILNKHPELLPGAYRKLGEGIWGITSNKGRHIHEGGEPTFNEAMLLVGVVTPLLQFLLAEAHAGSNDTAADLPERERRHTGPSTVPKRKPSTYPVFARLWWPRPQATG